MLAVGVLGADCALESVPSLETVEGIQERDGDRMCALGQDLVREVLAQLASQVPFALAVLNRVAEYVADRQRQRVVGIADDHLRHAVQSAKERHPGRHILAREGLKTPHPRHRRPLPRLGRLAADSRQHVKAAAGVGAAVDAEVLAAPAADQPHRVGILTVSSAPGFGDAIAKNLELKGYVLDRGLVIVTRSADGKLDRLPALAKELVAGAPEAIVTLGYPAAVAARKATTTIPLVVTSAGDPVATGFAASLNRPGGDITGVSDVASELSAKRLQLLKAAVPGLKRVAMLYNADDLGMTLRYKAAEAAAKGLGIAVQPLGVREPDDFDAAFAAMTRDKPDGIMMVTDVLTILNRKRVFEFAAAQAPAGDLRGR